MGYQIADPVRMLPGVGPIVYAQLIEMGIETVGDLIRWFPRGYLFANQLQSISSLRFNQLGVIKVAVKSVHKRYTKQSGKLMVEAEIYDSTGTIKARWFNQPFLVDKLRPNTEWILIGKLVYFNQEKIIQSPIIETEPKVIPRYAQTKSINSKRIATLVQLALDKLELKPALPQQFNCDFDIVSTIEALGKIHCPNSEEEAMVAKKALSYEEVFHFLLDLERAELLHQSQKQAIALVYSLELLQSVVASLPFVLTKSQKQAVWAMVQELQTGQRMVRLLVGDVGSGKTVVAGILAVLFAKMGKRVLIMAPTEVLATQHYQTLTTLMGAVISVGLCTGSVKQYDSTTDLIIGTHALLYDPTVAKQVGLMIIDEQHRFGVAQRNQLQELISPTPHTLSMTATPIPRTLALSLFANLKVTYLTEKPASRLSVITKLIRQDRAEMEQQVQTQIAAGRQVFVVCPLIVTPDSQATEDDLTLFAPSESLSMEKKAVEGEVKRLQSENANWGVIRGLHGKLKPQEKRQIMEQFQAGQIQVLVTTTVIEVGVDVPNASVIIIEGAESFGLAQLHQLRGRVGRSTFQSYCYLCPSKSSVAIEERLQALVDTDDGFLIAEADLAQRGPGDLSGLMQSGLPDFKFTALDDYQLFQSVRNWIKQHRSELGEWPSINSRPSLYKLG